MKIVLQEEWNPSGYYVVTVNITLQFDPVLLKHLQHISVVSYVSSQSNLLNIARKSTEYIYPEHLVSMYLQLTFYLQNFATNLIILT